MNNSILFSCMLDNKNMYKKIITKLFLVDLNNFIPLIESYHYNILLFVGFLLIFHLLYDQDLQEEAEDTALSVS